jgi:hypothetical protein
MLQRVEVNGEPGAMAFDTEGKLVSVIAAEIAGGQIQSVYSIVNPEKLSYLGQVADVNALFAGAKRGRQ